MIVEGNPGRRLAPAAPVPPPAPPGTAGAAGVVDTSQSPHASVRSVSLGAARWTDGFWADRFRLCGSATVPAVYQALLDPANSEHLANFRIAAGLEPGSYRSTDWSDGDCYKWIEAAALVYEANRDPALGTVMDEWIAVIAKAQRPDGFISTNALLRPDRQPLDVPYTHQLYNMGHLLTAACVHYRATGKDDFLRVAVRTADFLDHAFRDCPSRLVHFPWNPSAYMGLVELYRTTRDRRYLALAETLIANRGSSPGGGDHRNGGTDQTQDRVPLRQEDHAVGHAVCAMYLYAGAADVYLETGETALLQALERIWQNVTNRQMYITGAVGAGSGCSLRGDTVHEAFLGDDCLPERAYAETCANLGNALWNYRLLQATGETRFADVVERVLYNSLLSAVGLEGKTFFYCNPLAWDGTLGQGHHTGRRWTTESKCYCCPPSVARTVAQLHNWAYGVSEDAVWINLYGGSTLSTAFPDGGVIRLAQQTDYPWSGGIRIAVTQAPDRPVSIRLRIPGWAEGATLKVDGRPVEPPPAAGSYTAVRRQWAAGSIIELELPMPVRLIEARPSVKGLENKVAVMRGPLVYCLEWPVEDSDLQAWVDGICLPETARFTSRRDPRLLGGITVLDGVARASAGRACAVAPAGSLAQSSVETAADGGPLYRAFRPRGVQYSGSGTVPVTLIPYYAWANRGLSYMKVWIPLAR